MHMVIRSEEGLFPRVCTLPMIGWLCGTMLAFLSCPSRAADIAWTATAGSYLDPANWSTNTVPVAGDVARIANGGTATLTLAADRTGPQLAVGFDGTGTLVVGGSGTMSVSALSSVGYTTTSSVVAGDGRLEIGSGAGVRLTGAGTVGGGAGAVGGTGVIAVGAGGVFTFAGGGQRLIVGETAAGNTSTGTIDVAGTFSITGGELEVGRGQGGGGQGLGTVTVSTGGVLNTNNWTKFGTKPFDGAGGGGLGRLVISGGTVNKTGGGNLIFGDFNGTGEIDQSGGLLNMASGSLYVGSYGTGGIGTYTLSAGTLEVTSGELSVGKSNGAGTLTMTGGSIVKRGTADFEIGDGGSGTGTVTITGGTVAVLGGDVAVGKFGGSGSLSIGGTGVMRAGKLVLSKSGASVQAVVNLDVGGRLEATQVTSADFFAFTEFNFNGGRLVAAADSDAFMADIFSANINNAVTGAVIDTQGFAVTMSQPLAGVGGLVKEGSGSLRLTGPGTYSGPTNIASGTLGLSTQHIGGGQISIGTNATLGVNVASLNSRLSTPALSLGTGSQITIDVGTFGETSLAPLNIQGGLTTGGAAAVINFASTAPAAGTVPLIQYGSLDNYSFTLGSLPAGVQATLVNNTAENRIDLLIAGISVRRWQGDVSDQWNTTQANWLNTFSGSGTATTFADGDGPVVFDDSASGATSVALNQAVAPLGTQFTNEVLSYSLSGSGSLGGSGGLTKSGAGALTLATANTFTGPVRLEGGTTTVSSVANAGVASPLGAAGAAPENLVLAGGRLAYAGSTGSTDRGLSIVGGTSGIEVSQGATVLSIGGRMVAEEGSFRKTGPGTLRFIGNGSTNVLAAVESGAGVVIEAGTIALEGTGADATSLINTMTGEFHVGGVTDQAADLTVTNATLDVGSWLSIGHDTGTANTSASLSDATVTAANLRLGFGSVANSGTHSLSLTDSSLQIANETLIANIGPSVGLLSLAGSSSIRSGGNFLVGNSGGTRGTVTLGDSSTLTSVGQLRIGDGGTGELAATGSATLTVDQLLIGNAATSAGTLSLGGDATLNASGYIAVGNSGTGTLAMSGNAELTVQFDLNIADLGDSTGALSLADAATAAAGSLFVGKNPGSTGTVTVSGGRLSQTQADGSFVVGRDGPGTLTIGGAGEVVAAATGGLLLAATGTSQSAAINLDGGVLEVARISRGSGTGAVVAFNGGTLRASPTATGSFIAGLDSVLVLPGGATIDSAGRTISVDQPLVDGGGGGLSKIGSGTLVLAADSFYSGPTAVTAGTLLVNANNSLAIGSVSVATGGTLAGTGTIGGSTTIAAAGTLAPGNSPGTLTFAQGLTLGAGGNYNWQLTDAAGTAGIAWDTVTVAGVLDITATAIDPFAINLWTLSSTGPDVDGPAANFNASSSYSWRLATAASITGFSANAFDVVTTAANGTAGFANSISGGTFSVAVSGNDLNLIFTPGGPSSDIVIDVPSGTQTQGQAGYPAIASATSVTKVGLGTVVFDAANGYAGPTTISAGTLEVAASDALAATSVTVDTAATLAIASGVTMRSPSVIVDGGTLSASSVAVDSTAGITSLAINAGTLAGAPALTIGSGGEMALVQDARVSVAVGSLSVVETSGGGRLDLGAGQVTVAAAGTTPTALRADIIAGRNGGAWNGSAGIMSSTAAAAGGNRAVGYVVNGDGSARVSFAAPGDTDLNGQVNVFDLIGIDSAGRFGTGQTAVWNQGDFNYDNVANVFDLISIDSSGAYGAGNYFPASPSAFGGSLAAVPEPGLLAVLGIVSAAGLSCLRRRRAG